MFKLFKKKECHELVAPVTGKSIDLTQVPDAVFASKMMGEGIAFELESDTICAPCDGKITMLTNTLHAVGITADNGAEILIHIGLDTVNLNGQGFKALVHAQDKVKKGTPLIQLDLDFLKQQPYSLITPMVVTNSAQFDIHVAEANKPVQKEDIVITF